MYLRERPVAHLLENDSVGTSKNTSILSFTKKSRVEQEESRPRSGSPVQTASAAARTSSSSRSANESHKQCRKQEKRGIGRRCTRPG